MAMPSHDQEERELLTASAAPSNHGTSMTQMGQQLRRGCGATAAFQLGTATNPIKGEEVT